jgi:hypothetical protein
MGRPQVTADELLARAEASGYKSGEHKEKDEIHDSRKHVEKTKKDQEAALHHCVLLNLGEMPRDYIQRGLPLPDEATARGRCLGEGVDATDLATAKDFLRLWPRVRARPLNDPPLTRPTPLQSGSLRASPVSRELRQMPMREVRCTIRSERF